MNNEQLLSGLNKLSKKRDFLVIGLLVVIYWLSILNTAFSELTGITSSAVYFLQDEEWKEFWKTLSSANWMSSNSYGYYLFFGIDFIFIILYAVLLLSFVPWLQKSRMFIDMNTLNGLKKPYVTPSKIDKPEFRYLIVVLLLVLSDVMENIYMLYCQHNIPAVSGLKFVLAGVILFYLFQRCVVRYWDEIRMLGYALWYCRLSLIGVSLFVLLLRLSQGKELMIYMIESEPNWVQMMTFNIIVALSAFTYWYLPRFFFKENPGMEIVSLLTKIQSRKERNSVSWNILRNYKNWRRNVDYKHDVPFDQAYQFQWDLFGASRPTRKKELESVRKRLLISVPMIIAMIFLGFVGVYFGNLWWNSDTTLDASLGESPIRNYLLKTTLIVVLAGIIRYFRKCSGRRKNEFWFQLLKLTTGACIMTLLIQGIFNLVGASNQYVKYVLVLEVVYVLLLACMIFSIVKLKFKELLHGRPFPKVLSVIHRVLLYTPFGCILLLIIYLAVGQHSNYFGITLLLLVAQTYYGLYVYVAGIGVFQKRTTFYLSGFIAIMIFANFISTNIDNNHLDVTLNKSKIVDQRITLEDHTIRFKNSLIAKYQKNKATSSRGFVNVPVYFIASNGGGTMQAYWTSRVLAELQIQSKDKFKDHVFALSGASGGSVGMGISSLIWDKGGAAMKDKLRLIYANDFMGGTIPRLLLLDPIVSLSPWNTDWLDNRQEWLSRRYASALGGALSEIWNKPFVDFWSDSAGLKPLYFANSTRAENGERYIASPVKMMEQLTQGQLFIEELNEINDSFHLTYGDCVMMTNRFPYVSNAGKIDRLGHFIDAGYHDNSGIETLMEVYAGVEDELFNSPNSDSISFYPVFIHINYGDAWNYDVTDRVNGPQRDLNEMIIPITAGIEGVFGERIINKVEALNTLFGDSCVHQIYLPRPGDLINYARSKNISLQDLPLDHVRVGWVNTPLGRTITKNQMNYVDSILTFDKNIQPGTDLHGALKHLNQ